MKFLFYFLSFALTLGYLLLFDYNAKLKKFKYAKQIFAGVLIALFIVRYFCLYRDFSIKNVYGMHFNDIDMLPYLGIDKFSSILLLIADFLSLTMFVTASMSLFFGKMRYVDAFIKYVFPIGSVLCLIFVEKIHDVLAVHILVANGAYEDYFDSRFLYMAMLMTECGAYIAVSVNKWREQIAEGYYKDKRNFAVKHFLIGIAVGLCMLAATMPAYFLQFTFGKLPGTTYAYDLNPTHRIFVYLMFVIPLSMYFILRNRDEKVIRFALIYLSVGTMITFSADYSYKTLTDISTWPFHLCNTAMYVVPICLIFKWKKLFYFTYFLNVFGAILAMLMPNYSETQNLLSYGFVRFWINHWCAFFFPLLIVALGQFTRPNIKLFGASMLWFFVYYVLVLFLNVYFTALGKESDYFFINSTFIADKLGSWAKQLFNLSASFTIGGIEFVFHPLYQLLYYVSYIILGFGMWFVYELFFSISAEHRELQGKLKKIRLDKYAALSKLNGRSIEEPMDPNSGTTLVLNNFSKRYGTNKYYSVHDVSLTVYGGEIFGFLGPNGAGKSTIIKSIVGIQPITEGSISVCGYDCAMQPVMSKRQIGYVPDHYALYEKLTGREYINYIADIFEVSKEDRDARISEYVRLFELEESIDSQIKTYSHGMKQKITIISALVHNPKIWILDEPLTGLDPTSIFQVKECMRRHAAEGNIVFFSSHLIDVVEKLCDRIGIIRKGELQCVKTLEEIESQSSLEQFYMKTIGETVAEKPVDQSMKVFAK